jgi:hypothetical protein
MSMSSGAASSVRKKRPYARSSKGCKTCRYDFTASSVSQEPDNFTSLLLCERLANHYPSIRHVKCDEFRPACKPCTSTGRICDGYTASEPADSWQIITPLLTTGNLGLIPQASILNDKANVSLHYFRNRTIAYMSGLFGSECGPVILRASAQNQAIYYATLAVGSIHKDLETRCDGNAVTSDEWATKQYINSIRSLTVKTSVSNNAQMDVVLATCVLYTCFEVSA